MREFDSGATRDSVDGKIDYEGFLSPRVLCRYAEYMNKHQVQADGQLRDSDNWQKGIPKDAYMKSAYRHFIDWWVNHRGITELIKDDIEESLCALLFNTMGYLHEFMKEQGKSVTDAMASENSFDITGAVSGRLTTDSPNAVEIDKPEFKRGDIVGITPRDSMREAYKLRIKEANYRGRFVGKLDSPVNIYQVRLGFHNDVNLYLDEIFPIADSVEGK